MNHDFIEKNGDWLTLSDSKKLEAYARRQMADRLCTLLITPGYRKAGRIQDTHFRFLGWIYDYCPNFEVDVRGFETGRVLRVDIYERKLRLGESDPFALGEITDQEFINMWARMQ